MISTAQIAARMPSVQNNTLRNPSWYTASPVMPKANSQNIGHLQSHASAFMEDVL